MKRRFLVEIDMSEKQQSTAVGMADIDYFILEVVRDGLLLLDDDQINVVEIEPEEISEHDRANVGQVMVEGDWFTAHLFRLLGRSDLAHRARLRVAFPETVAAWQAWHDGEG